MSFWLVNRWSAKYTVHPNFILRIFDFSNLMGTRFQKNLGREDHGKCELGLLAPGQIFFLTFSGSIKIGY